jgi:hypothetical protein
MTHRSSRVVDDDGLCRYARLVVVHSARARYDLVRNFVVRKFEKLLSTAREGACSVATCNRVLLTHPPLLFLASESTLEFIDLVTKKVNEGYGEK